MKKIRLSESVGRTVKMQSLMRQEMMKIRSLYLVVVRCSMDRLYGVGMTMLEVSQTDESHLRWRKSMHESS
jgi:hypothetical protein